MKPRDIDIHIDRIALAAMPAGGERRLREAIARELAETLGSRGDRKMQSRDGPWSQDDVSDRVRQTIVNGKRS